MQDVNSLHGRPLIFGEVLYDSFPDGQDVLGGAPFNVAWHLQGFGLSPLMLSRIGHDDLGGRVLATMRAWGMDAGGIQIDNEHPTGRVVVTLNEGQPRFEILPEQAYDYIETLSVLSALNAKPPPLLYHGTLAARTPTASASLYALRERAVAPVFVDINLRPPWFDLPRVERALTAARWVKLNDDELAALAGRELDATELPLEASRVREHYGLELLILTHGAGGATLFTAAAEHTGKPPPLERVVDTVGAGDAFSAVTLLGLMHAWSLELTLVRALEFAARICGQRGATAPDRDLYAQFRARWQA